MKFSQSARNQPGPPAVPSVPGGAAATPATGNAQAAPTTDIVQLLAQSEPQQQKQIIGEQLYRQIYTLHPEPAGKITGTASLMCCVQVL